MTEANTTPVESKPFWKSHSMWASIITMVAGFATTLGLPDSIAHFLNTNSDQIIGLVVTALGLYGAWGTARRKTKIEL